MGVASLLMDLLAVPSPTGQEGAICDLVATRVAEAAAGGQAVAWERHGDGVVARGPSRDGRPHVVLVGHLDTVPIVEGLHPPQREGDRITGRGAVDMKAGVAVMLDLLGCVSLDAAAVDLSWVFYPREEGNFADNGLGELLTGGHVPLHGDLYLVLEPTCGQLELGCVGAVSADVTFLGQAAHSARPWQGRNAISGAGEWLAAMHRRQVEEVVRGGLTFRETYQVTLAHGGIAQNVVPDEFVCRINHRFAPGRSVDEATARLRQACAAADRFQVVDAGPAAEPCTGNPLLQRLQSTTGVDVRSKQAWTDVARLADLGLDAANFGPGDNALSHQQDEWISVEALQRFCDGLRRFVEGT